MTERTTTDEFETQQDVFVEPTALEAEHGFLFAGDKGQLSLDSRRVFAMLLQRRFIEAAEDKWAWEQILKNQNDLESRFHDMFLDLVVDKNYGVAYKVQLRHEELNIPILLRDDSYKRAETVVLLYLRSTFRQQVSQGAGAAFVDQEELTQHAMSFFSSDETNVALRQREVSAGIDQLAREGILKEASEGRYRISPIIEVLMPLERIKELTAWLEKRLEAVDSSEDVVAIDPLKSDLNELSTQDVEELRPENSDFEDVRSVTLVEEFGFETVEFDSFEFSNKETDARMNDSVQFAAPQRTETPISEFPVLSDEKEEER